MSSPFGGKVRTRALIAVALLGETYPRELARILGAPVSGVQVALRGLERDGLVAGRLIGRTRVYQLEPRYFALAQLRPYLMRLALGDPALMTAVEGLRRRPRRSGKPL